MDCVIEKFIELADDIECTALKNTKWNYWVIRFEHHPEIKLVIYQENDCMLLTGSLVHFGDLEKLINKLRNEYF